MDEFFAKQGEGISTIISCKKDVKIQKLKLQKALISLNILSIGELKHNPSNNIDYDNDTTSWSI